MKKYYLILFIFLFSFNLVQAAGLSVTPNELYLETKVKQEAETKLIIKNISKKATLYSIYSDEFTDQIEIVPDLFQLMPNETQKVKIKVKPLEPGIQATVISIIARDLNRQEFNAGTGVKVDLVIKALTKDNTLVLIIKLWLFVIILVLIIFIIYFIIRHRRRNRFWYKVTHPVNLIYKKPWYKNIFK